MFCPKCGAQLKDGAKFCSKCGNKMNQVSSEPASAGQETAGRPEAPVRPGTPVMPEVPVGSGTPVMPEEPVSPEMSDIQDTVICPEVPDFTGAVDIPEVKRPVASVKKPESGKRPRAEKKQAAMAQQAASMAPAPKKKKKSGVLIVILLLLLLFLLAAIGGGAFYYWNSKNDEAMLESIQKEYGQEAEGTSEEESSLESEADLETAADTLSEPTTAVPTEGATEAATMAIVEPVTAEVKYSSEISLNGMVRAGVLQNTAYDSSHVVQENSNIDNSGWSAFDGQSITSWQESVDGDGIGEYAGIGFDREYQVQVITFLLGNHRSDSWYVRNNVPQTLTINLGGQVFQASFPKEMVEFAVVLSRPVAASEIKVTIDAVYPGTQYTDTIISEVGVYGN